MMHEAVPRRIHTREKAALEQVLVLLTTLSVFQITLSRIVPYHRLKEWTYSTRRWSISDTMRLLELYNVTMTRWLLRLIQTPRHLRRISHTIRHEPTLTKNIGCTRRVTTSVFQQLTS